ncbi:anti-sigma factor family protein [Pontibacillus salicampi]|uniref:Anti-sigma-W factor RsiW n=1 Tax=Pontibacillus salicampi TaxID=1449801 RepID=A0ABV6LPR6_9BACI
MRCSDLGSLQAYLDDELSREDKKQVMQHLRECSICRQYVQELKELEHTMDTHFGESDMDMDVEAAWSRFENQITSERTTRDAEANVEVKREDMTYERKGWDNMKQKTKGWLIAGVTAATLVGSLAIPQVQVAADNFLSIFRVNQMEIVKITESDLNQMESEIRNLEDGTIDLKGVGEIETKTEGEIKSFDSLEKAEQAGYSLPQINQAEVKHDLMVKPSSTITFQLNVEDANAMLQQIGSDNQLDNSLDGKPFSLKLAESYEATYETEDNRQFMYQNMGAPEISVPKGASVDEIRSILTELPFLPENIKSQINSIDNLEKTLPIPYMQDRNHEMNEIDIQGSKGYAVAAEYANFVVWQSGEEFHILESYNQDEEALTVKDLEGYANAIAK